MKVFKPKPNNELFKVTNVDAFTTKRLIKKHPLWNAFIKIKDKVFNEHDTALTKAFDDVMFNSDGGSFDKPKQTIYIYVAGDGAVSVTKSLKVFSEGYRSEKEWNIKSWVEIK
jgi:hypothetical protein